MSRAVQVLIPAAFGVALVAYGMHVAAHPLGEEARQQCLTDRKGPYFTTYGNRIGFGPIVDGTLCMLFGFFNNICRTLVGKALGTIFASIMFPGMAVTLLGANGRPAAIAFQIAVVALGQLVSIGVALSAIWLPAFWLSLQHPQSTVSSKPAASPAAVATALGLSLVLAFGMSLPTFVVTASHPIWIWANLVFQLFPLALVPVLFATGPAKDARTAQNKIPYANLLNTVGLVSAPLWWTGVVQALLDFKLPGIEEGKDLSGHLLSPLFLSTLQKPVLPLRLRPTLAVEFNEGARFLVFDMLAVISTMTAGVMLHARSPKSVPGAFSLPRYVLLALVGGPGLAFASYWAQIYRHESAQRKKTETFTQSVTQYRKRFDKEDEQDKSAAEAWHEKRKENAARMADEYYDFATQAFLSNWSPSFHYTPFSPQHQTLREAQAFYQHRLALFLQLQPTDLVLDVGCGIGGPALEIARLTGCKVIGCTFIRADFCCLPFPDNTFDAAFAIEATCHAADLAAVYKEIARVVKKNQKRNCCAISEWVLTPTFDATNLEHVRVRHRIERGNGLANLPTLAHARHAFRAAGFHMTHSEDFARHFDYVYHSTASHDDLGQNDQLLLQGLPPPPRLYPQGVTGAMETMKDAVDGVREGGELGILSPAWWLIGTCAEAADAKGGA
ncbi:hypothetical protein DV737_g3381, partial [Chaetothyriales sp. CBS 132003]